MATNLTATSDDLGQLSLSQLDGSYSRLQNRGVTWRGLGDGGKQEYELAKQYERMNKVMGSRWPKMRAVLESMAKHYEQYAKHEDSSSEFRDLNRVQA